MKFFSLLNPLLNSARGLVAPVAGPAAVAATGGAVGTICSLSLAIGAIYLVDCRFVLRGNPESCYTTAALLAGVGVGVRGGFQAGYTTYNPALRRPEEEEEQHLPDRDASGRFVKRNDP